MTGCGSCSRAGAGSSGSGSGVRFVVAAAERALLARVFEDGSLVTPPLGGTILPGITRDSVIQICQELGITVKERTIQRAALYVADELFFSGTAAEVTPIRSVDRITVGQGGRGPITEKIQKVFFEITKGEREAPGPLLENTDELVDALTQQCPKQKTL